MWRRGALIAPLTLVPSNPAHVNLQFFTDCTAWTHLQTHISFKSTLIKSAATDSFSSGYWTVTACVGGASPWQHQQLITKAAEIARFKLQELQTKSGCVTHIRRNSGRRERSLFSLIPNMLTLQFLKRIVHHTLQDIYWDCSRGSDTPPHVISLT